MMDFFDLEGRSIGVNLVVFVAAAAVLCFAGAHLAKFAKELAEKGRLGQAFVGTVFLGVIVSLPEATMAVTAAVMNEPELAAGTLLGGIVFCTLILAVTDAVIGKEPLSSDIAAPIVPLQGALVVLMLLVAAAGLSTGDVPVGGVGAWTSGLFVLYIAILWLVKHTQASHPWVVADEPRKEPSVPPAQPVEEARPVRRLALMVSLAAIAILVSGIVATQTAEVLATKTGLGEGLVGLVLGGIATSLPEAASTYSAVRLRQYEMAFSDAFGTNIFSVMLLFVCDLAFPGGPLLNELGRFSLFATLLGAAVTAVYVAGLLGRPRRVILRMGIDSALVLLMSIGGLLLLYRLR
jgi:cation:H+ antiporter